MEKLKILNLNFSFQRAAHYHINGGMLLMGVVLLAMFQFPAGAFAHRGGVRRYAGSGADLLFHDGGNSGPKWSGHTDGYGYRLFAGSAQPVRQAGSAELESLSDRFRWGR